MFEVACGLLLVGGTLLVARVVEAADLLRFPLCWAGVLIALDGIVRLRRGRSPLARPSDWLACAAASLVFWDLFELLDLRLRNWWYTGVSEDPWAGAAFGALSFATVLPAARLGFAALSPREEPELRGEARGSRPRTLLLVGLAALAAALAFPQLAFPLAWLYLWPLCEAAVASLPRQGGVPSPLEARRAHDPRVVVRLLLLALPLGLIWESLNWRCPRGWVYTVPGFEHPKLFEMPLPGYLGYLPFLLECGAALALLDRLRPQLRGWRGLAALAVIFALHGLVDQLSRGKTILSTAPALSQLRTFSPRSIALLAAEGVRTPRDLLRRGAASLGPRAAQELRQVAELAEATQMGVPRAERFVLQGIEGARGLAAARWEEVAARTGEDPGLVRLWIEAARSSVSR